MHSHEGDSEAMFPHFRRLSTSDIADTLLVKLCWQSTLKSVHGSTKMVSQRERLLEIFFLWSCVFYAERRGP